jgi:peptidoglycan/xylan/chitin deacetylase (PgdA/CDA1 family)
VLLVGLVVLAGGVTGLVLGDAGSDDPGSKAVRSTAAVHGKHASATGSVAKAKATPTADPRDPAHWPLSGAKARSKRVPILMYHLIAAAPAGTAYPGLWVPPTELGAQVKALGSAGFTGVTLGEVWDAWHGDGRLPSHPIVLSFDDGDISQVLGGAPVLKDAGWPGVLNLATNHLGKGGIPMWGAKRLIKQGWDIDSHTVTHPDVTALPPAALEEELKASKKAIKSRLGVTAKFFCYPAGRNDPASRAAVKAAGYLAATTTQPGLAARTDDPFVLPRLRVDPGMSGSTVVALAKGTRSQRAGTGE